MMLAETKVITQGEKLQTMENLWNIMYHDDNVLKPPKGRGNIFAERREKMQSDEVKFITIEDLKTASC